MFKFKQWPNGYGRGVKAGRSDIYLEIEWMRWAVSDWGLDFRDNNPSSLQCDETLQRNRVIEANVSLGRFSYHVRFHDYRRYE